MAPQVRLLIQQCTSARLRVSFPMDPEEFVSIEKGMIVYLTFLKDATKDVLPELIDLLLSVRLCFDEETKRNSHNITEAQGDLMLVPQATLGGKLKGKNLQYHANAGKEESAELYHSLVKMLRQARDEGASQGHPKLRNFVCGTYGNQQVLEMASLGPYTHLFEI